MIGRRRDRSSKPIAPGSQAASRGSPAAKREYERRHRQRGPFGICPRCRSWRHAALDVFASEPPPPDSIARHPRVIATPHIGAQTQEGQALAGQLIAEEVSAVLEGREPRFRVMSNE